MWLGLQSHLSQGLKCLGGSSIFDILFVFTCWFIFLLCLVRPKIFYTVDDILFSCNNSMWFLFRFFHLCFGSPSVYLFSSYFPDSSHICIKPVLMYIKPALMNFIANSSIWVICRSISVFFLILCSIFLFIPTHFKF